MICSDWLPELSGIEGREIKYLRGPISTPRVPPRGTRVGIVLAWAGCYKVGEFSQRGCALLASCCRRWRIGQPLVRHWLAVASVACNLLARQGVVSSAGGFCCFLLGLWSSAGGFFCFLLGLCSSVGWLCSASTGELLFHRPMRRPWFGIDW